MTVTLTATPTAPTSTTTVPAPGEGVTSAATQGYVQKIINEGAFRDNRMSALEALVPGSNASDFYTIWIPIRSKMTTEVSSPAPWYISYGTFTTRPLLITAGTTAEDCIFDLSAYLPRTGHLNQVDVFLRGASGHAALPANMPVYNIYSQALDFTSGTDPTVTTIVTATDSSGSVAAFEKLHSMNPVFMTAAIDSTLQYMLRITSESGANSVIGETIVGIQMTVSG